MLFGKINLRRFFPGLINISLLLSYTGTIGKSSEVKFSVRSEQIIAGLYVEFAYSTQFFILSGSKISPGIINCT